MQPTGLLRCVLRDGVKVLQQEIRCFENEVWENELLVKADGEYKRRWIDVPTVFEVND